MRQQVTLTARRLITAEGSLDFPVIGIDAEGQIIGIGSDPAALADETETLAACYLDIHHHGAAGIDVMNASPRELQKMQRFLARHGVAKYLPTTITAPLDFTLGALDRLASLIEADIHIDEAHPAGIHIEGPFLSHSKRGMHPAEFLQQPSIELFDRLQSAARGHIRLMTIAPERWSLPEASPTQEHRASATELIRHASAQGVRCSIGHSDGLRADALAAIDAGAVSATHTFNAMRPLDHREPGILGTVLDDDRLFADLICDGVHVDPVLVRLWRKAKGPERAILITDALSATGMPDGNYTAGSTPVTVQGEHAWVTSDLQHGKHTLAGSVLTLQHAVENLRIFTGAGLDEAVRMAAHNPAAMLGRREWTSLQTGAPANLNRFNWRGKLIATYLQGTRVSNA
ncbi:N-acetylglucosamine-6-phosphate deacetylase [Terriglobus aquaticus]|uniref:N-acetylglucosamine-6-phosphate deacetylase n=1 Tax=Terriglobus aquaticus TaxID=940139 RepID=A0ABW9KI59_9BACT|nr:N-acetylglucosamine-6-phosphate deacetylase [Terriglobus aquaticus]